MGNHASNIVTVKTTDNKTFTLYNADGSLGYTTTSGVSMTSASLTFTPAKYAGNLTGYVMG
jgi:hypothetical protein